MTSQTALLLSLGWRVRIGSLLWWARFGRKTAAVFAGTMGAILGITKSFSASFWMYVTLEGLEAAIGDALSPIFMLIRGEETRRALPNDTLELLHRRSDTNAVHRLGCSLLETLPTSHLRTNTPYSLLLIIS
ncbi:unnamed protein product [Leptidea sinapis]|uniref:Uncharacterized protein n=1 Tax=Leptidea sinapis TaxID=189913 RepID=A0A5E4QJZ3_9NEOP|nr:unnamed protein product [Leptidea sinapis]